ncbi:MAG: hypothetical protein JXB88_03600 [Spirochaetales bacterium]|nr:hypothetical protein [Spirochaetales bacterium]
MLEKKRNHFKVFLPDLFLNGNDTVCKILLDYDSGTLCCNPGDQVFNWIIPIHLA